MIFLGLRVRICSVKYLFSLAHWQQLLFMTLGLHYLCIVLLDAHIVQLCSSGVMAQYADLYAVDIKSM